MEQLQGLVYYIEKNPLLLNDLLIEMDRRGATPEELETAEGFQAWLVKLQLQSFVHGSAIFSTIFARRADINRSVKGIQKAHCYKHFSSVCYMKKVLQRRELAKVTKTSVTSKVRSRVYFIDEKGVKREAYKWNERLQTTIFFLCDDIIPLAAA